MKKILDKTIIGFFVVVFGCFWYCGTKYYIKPDHHKIVIHDVFGKQVSLDEIRTIFRIYQVAQSHISEYQKRFPHYSFSIATHIPETGRTIFRRLRKDHK